MRCYRCNACQSQWEIGECRRCGYPAPDRRTQEQIADDETDINEEESDLHH